MREAWNVAKTIGVQLRTALWRVGRRIGRSTGVR
jgi:hypothetical protein